MLTQKIILSQDDVCQDVAIRVDYRRAGVVSRRLEAQDPEGPILRRAV